MKKVAPYKTTIDPGSAYWMARLSKAVYTQTAADNQHPDEAAILADLQAEDGGFLSVEGYSESSAQAAVIEHEAYICMSFRGTNERDDWLDNLNAFPEKALFGEFHRGFYTSVNDVWAAMLSRYGQLKANKKRPVFFTGHSLGGAMAAIAAARFIHRDWPFTAVYTFGQPRALTRETARIFNAECQHRFFRFQNNNDIVTRVPARLMGYSHVGTFIYISKKKRLHNDPGYWFKFLDYMEGALEAVPEDGLDGVEDHDIDDYLAAVSEWNEDFEI